MTGLALRQLINVKCVPCTYFLGCKIQEGFKDLSKKELLVKQRDYDKLQSCLFFKEIK